MANKHLNAAFESAPYTTSGVMLALVVYCDWANPSGYVYGSIKSLANRAKQSRRQFQRHTRRLIQDGFLIEYPSKGRRTTWLLTLPDAWFRASAPPDLPPPVPSEPAPPDVRELPSLADVEPVSAPPTPPPPPAPTPERPKLSREEIERRRAAALAKERERMYGPHPEQRGADSAAQRERPRPERKERSAS